MEEHQIENPKDQMVYDSYAVEGEFISGTPDENSEPGIYIQDETHHKGETKIPVIVIRNDGSRETLYFDSQEQVKEYMKERS